MLRSRIYVKRLRSDWLPQRTMSVSTMLRAVFSNADPFTTNQGFMEEPDEFVTGSDPDVEKFTKAFPHCAVMPLSKLTVNETGVNNGDITSFMASFYVRARRRVECQLRCQTKRGRG